ncbi:MAG: hypothetical protein JXR25_02470 [Pontiellaceae bacterium]|nr:hypothetical protein [Pontiellaceae bacterium]
MTMMEMVRRRGAAGLAALGMFFLLGMSLEVMAEAPIAVFGREDFYTLNASQSSKLKNSGFNTAILFVVDVEANGDLNYNGNHLLVQDGVYVGDKSWGNRLAALKVPPTSITRIEVCTGGAGARSWANIKDLIAAEGTGPDSILYRNFMALKDVLDMDAICNDDEVAYDAESAATFNRMITSMGMENTLCPYNYSSYWQSIFNNSEIDAVYLQCYDGGAYNNPATWNSYFGGFKVAPGDWSNDGLATVESKFTEWSPDINGGFIWQFEFISAADLARFGAIINKAVDPLIVSPDAGFSGAAAFNQFALSSETAFEISNRGDDSFSWSVINTSSWLNVSSSSGTLAGGASTTVTASLDIGVATNLTRGDYSADVIFSNRTSGITVSRTFALNTAVANWPIEFSGCNASLLAANTATAGAPGATAFDVRNNWCFYQEGLDSSTRGLPLSGAFSSQCDPSTAFQLGPYGSDPDSLMLGYTYASSGTLTFDTPQAYNSLAILASSANGGGQGTLVLNFSDGSQSPAFAFNAQDWFYTVSNVAVQGFGRLRLDGTLATEDNGDTNPNMYQTSLNLAALGITKPIESITFYNPADAGANQNTAVFALSGMPASIPLQVPGNLEALPGTNGTVQLFWDAVAGATEYNVKLSLERGGAYTNIAQVTEPTVELLGLTNGTTYYFVVSAFGTLSESPDSDEVSAMPGSYLSWAFDAAPVAYWPMNESSGSVAHDLIDGNDGAHSGGYTFSTGGVVGDGFDVPHRAITYNGSSGSTTIPRVIGATDFSIVFWVKTSSYGGTPNWYNGKGLVDGEVGGVQNDFGVSLVGARVGFGIGNPDTTLTSVKSINNNVWHQVVVTRNAGSGAMRIYIDGALDKSGTGPTGSRTTPANLRIGAMQTGINFLSGSMSDVAMYDQVLTPEQVATLYRAASGLFYDVPLDWEWEDGSMVLSWPGNGLLLEADSLLGPWSTNTLPSPVIIVPDQPQRFYRIQTH